MKVLVVHASRHGATRGIAERIHGALASQGLDASIAAADAPRDLTEFDGFVIGSAIYLGSWLKEATDFITRNERAFEGKPVWLFSSGPLGTSPVDAQGHDLVEGIDAKAGKEIGARLHARGTQVFFGAFDPSEPPASMSERFVRMMPAFKRVLPPGDFRDWTAVDAWARQIAAELAPTMALA